MRHVEHVHILSRQSCQQIVPANRLLLRWSAFFVVFYPGQLSATRFQRGAHSLRSRHHSTLLGGTATITHNCQTGSVNSGTCAFREDDRLRRKVQSKLLGNATDDRGRCAVHQRVLQWFLASSDEIAVLFVNTDFNTQKNMLLMSLVHVASFDPIHGSDAIMKRFAIRHRDLHVLSHLYRLWLESLLDTVKAYDLEYD